MKIIKVNDLLFLTIGAIIIGAIMGSSEAIAAPSIFIHSKNSARLGYTNFIEIKSIDIFNLCQNEYINIDELVKSRKTPFFVIPAEAGHVVKR